MDKVKILNIFIDNLSMSEFLEDLEFGIVFTPNVDHLVKLQKDQEFRQAYDCADYKVCDSQLILFLSKLLGSPIKERVSGSDLFPAFCQHHKNNENIKIFLLGAAEGVALKAQYQINQKIGRQIIADVHSPSFGFEKNEKECQEIIGIINQSGATVLAVGVGSPKQEKFISKYKKYFPKIKIFLAIGATIDFEAGNVKRAPRWLSNSGLEWLYRLLSEPKRLWKRYLFEDVIFFWLVLKQKFNFYVEPFMESISTEENFNFQVTFSNNTAVMRLPDRLTVIEAVTWKNTYQDLLQESLKFKEIVLDFSQTKFIDSSAIGVLISNYKRTVERGIELLLRGVNPTVMAVLEMTGLDQILTIESPRQRKSLTNPVSWPKCQLPTTHPSVRSGLKRFLDILGAIVGLGITAVVFVPIVIAIKLDNPGPIFFSQIRCGWMGQQFRIWKFRSMCVGAERLQDDIDNHADGKIFKNENDPRITRVGRFLRKTSLDELPQFWNVLKGEMSLVGTRPPIPKEVEIYDVPEWQRLDVKPGMTGEWQVNGRSKIRNFEDIIKLDLRYQENWSLMHDLKLIVKTITVVFDKDSGGGF
ncbi:WecB/TagA/CpsF family glycosyltransferase [Coleofasciculus sp. LEGE 07092]|nr:MULTISPECIES: WecB/TagA/CpsF family glycosyltransferase [unclassified Coleofasciculus]MBE9125763.1 WecB/TagA/CpsF family glycosyltransferase [Coleofasciculus sp. LEGE 07081]MBE9148436.1 WecB/TagA/CpsF family glycosyltransferase [Coleofasciculus sp. LEGE 07092]